MTHSKIAEVCTHEGEWKFKIGRPSYLTGDISKASTTVMVEYCAHCERPTSTAEA